VVSRRIAAYTAFVLVAIFTAPLLEAQRQPDEGLSLHINRGAARHGSCCRVFTVNPQYATLDQLWDERFSQPSEFHEYVSQYRAFMTSWPGLVGESEVSLEDHLKELDESGRRFVLSAETLHIKDRAWLALENASSVNPQQGIIFDAASRGGLTLDINVESGYLYGIQFFLEPLGPGIFQILSNSDQHQYQDPNGEMKSIFVSLQAMSSGWTRLELNRTFGVGFILHAVDVVATEQRDQ
jgi:hypothetical protein